ncbi:hypothetical protein SUGI_0408250 [Cryptomeria japonica]|nr:hypothetical protein SUGI_0408250 [Cryptomeria japonica]
MDSNEVGLKLDPIASVTQINKIGDLEGGNRVFLNYLNTDCRDSVAPVSQICKNDDLEEQKGDFLYDLCTRYFEEDDDSDSDDDESVYNDAGNCDFDPREIQSVESDERNEATQPIDIVFENIKKQKLKVREKGLGEVLWARRRGQILMEGFVGNDEMKGFDALSEGADVNQNSKACPRTKSLTDEDLDELKGCLDLGFGFNYEEIPELCNTLPALELAYSISQKFQDEQQRSPVHKSSVPAVDGSMSDGYSNNSSCTQSPIANWKISSPGDNPEQVKARLKFWAQAVACTVRLCS